jgi:hypothetical protein
MEHDRRPSPTENLFMNRRVRRRSPLTFSFLSIPFFLFIILFYKTPIFPVSDFFVHPNSVSLRVRYRTPSCWNYALSKVHPVTELAILKSDTLTVDGFGGFGNQFASFIRGLFLCYIFGYERISVIHLAICLNHPFISTDHIEIVFTDSTFHSIDVNSFEADGSPDCPLDDIRIAATIRDEVLRCLPKVPVNDSVLYICARGGELIEKGTPFWWHGQPPCHYYTDAMKMDGHPTVVMSNHDRPSPCVQDLLKLGATYGSVETPLHDLARFVHSRRMVVSRTSFTTAIMLLSKPKDVLYAFVTKYSMCIWPNHTYLHDYYDRFGQHHKCRATEEYDEFVLKEWHATDEQMEMMEKTEKGCVWEFG